MGANTHPTVKPEQLRRDEVHIVLRGDDLHEYFDDEMKDLTRSTIRYIVEEDIPIEVEGEIVLDREDR